MIRTYAEKRFFKWQEDEVSVSLRAQSGSYGGGSEVLVVQTLVFDEAQITSPLNRNVPRWGGCCHTLSNEAGRTVVIIRHEDPDGTRIDSTECGED